MKKDAISKKLLVSMRKLKNVIIEDSKLIRNYYDNQIKIDKNQGN